MDDNVDPIEQAKILSLIQQSYSLSAEQARFLMALTEQQRKQATGYFQFSPLINKHCNLQQTVGLSESLWKIVDLLYVPHTAFIMTKNGL
jgi:uncharacterized tellurite resistance protein B-like protein